MSEPSHNPDLPDEAAGPETILTAHGAARTVHILRRICWACFMLLLFAPLLAAADYACRQLRSEPKPAEFKETSDEVFLLVVAALCWGGASVIHSISRQLHAWLVRARTEARLCVHCGYNLTGTPSAKCPECGRPVGARDQTV